MRIFGHKPDPAEHGPPAWRRPPGRVLASAAASARHPSPRPPTSEPGGRPGAMRARSPDIHAAHQHTYTQRAHRAPADEPNRRVPGVVQP
eukprot:3879550-Prymnesium_polylepis.1